MGVHTLRSRLVCIAQDPVLFSGDLRHNLDPFRERTDACLWKAVTQVGLARVVLDRVLGKGNISGSGVGDGGGTTTTTTATTASAEGSAEGEASDANDDDGDRILLAGSDHSAMVAAALAMRIEPYGDNLSVGQRQLLCIARALVRRDVSGARQETSNEEADEGEGRGGGGGGGGGGGAKAFQPCIILLDEATASIDRSTDDVIQRVLKRVFMTGSRRHQKLGSGSGSGDANETTRNGHGHGHEHHPPEEELTSGAGGAPCTVLAIAHRIETIIDSDLVVVMDKGAAAEFDAPAALLADPASAFTALCAAAKGGTKEGGRDS